MLLEGEIKKVKTGIELRETGIELRETACEEKTQGRQVRKHKI